MYHLISFTGMKQILCFILLLDVEPQYSGARIEGDVVTLDFVKKMMDDFKNQKCLHKRYCRIKFHCISVSLLKCYWNVFILVLLHCFRYAYQIVLQTREMLQALPSLVDINIPDGKHFTVCGDVHGQVIYYIPWIVLNISC